MTIKIDLLKNNHNAVPRLAEIWGETLGKAWLPNTPLERVEKDLLEHLNDDSLPLTFVALEGMTPIGMCSLRENDGIRPDLIPWLGSLVVDPAYQKRGVGKELMNAVQKKAQSLGFHKLYLFAFDVSIVEWYKSLGRKFFAQDEFKGHSVTVMKLEIE